MSEYQYYEFLSLDRTLSAREMRELRRVSSRAEITPTRFTNHYDFGDFKGDPSRWMERYFDAFLYFANWNIRAVSLRVPGRYLDLATARRYCRTPSANARGHGPWIILDFESQHQDEDCSELPTGSLGAIAPARIDVAAGDHRLLFLGWLLAVQAGEADEGSPPPYPPGLGELTGPLAAFADYLVISPALLSRATKVAAPGPDLRQALRSWAGALPQRELVRWVERLALPDGPYSRAALLAEVRAGPDGLARSSVAARSRTSRRPRRAPVRPR